MRLAFYSGIIDEVKTGTGVHLTELLRQLIRLRPEAEYISFLPSLRKSSLHQEAVKRLDPAGRIQPVTWPVPAKIFNFSQTYLHFPPPSPFAWPAL